jgi:very-short-patch-repair endonuclease
MSIHYLKNRDWLLEQYSEKNRSMQDIANELNTNRQRIRRALIRLGIPPRDKSEAQKAALEAGRSQHPTLGQARSDTVKQRIAESVEKSWAEASEATLLARSQKAKEQWERMTPQAKSNLLKKAQDAVRVASREGSKLERYMRDELTKAGYELRYHVMDVIPNQKLEVDLLIPSLSVAIEIDGPSHFLPIWGDDNLQRNIRSDLEKNGLLLGHGFVVIRIKQMNNHVSKLKQRKILAQTIKALESVQTEFPKKNDRLIEIEV